MNAEHALDGGNTLARHLEFLRLDDAASARLADLNPMVDAALPEAIDANVGAISAGASEMGRVADDLSRMIEKVGEISQLVSEIAQSSKEQSVGPVRVNTAINEMDQVTQQNASMVEQTTAASRSLEQEAEMLVQGVARFRVFASTATAVARAGRVHAAIPAMKSVGGRGVSAVRKPQSDVWEEF